MTEPFMQRERKISRFFAKQLLHDYRNNELDPIRRRAVEQCLQEDPELRRELDYIEKADLYCRTLMGTRISPDFVEELAKERSLGEKLSRITTWRRWPEMARWTIEAMAVSAVVVALIVFIPWQGIKDQFVQRVIFQSAPTSQLAIPEVIEKRLESKEEEQNRLANLEVEAIEKSIETDKSSEVVVASKKSSAGVDEIVEPKHAPRGLLYRMMMRVPHIAEKTQDLKRRIQDMGGAKAGNVELGWRKPHGNYFHFSFPESRYHALISVLGEYGAVRVYKNPHERVMPEGQIRVILWVEDGEVTPTTGPVKPEPTDPPPEAVEQ